jgi:PmbA protein
MLGSEFVEERIARAVELSNADEVQTVLVAQDYALTRFANNIIHQNVSEKNGTMTISAIVGRRTGKAATNDLSDAGLAKAAERALSHAKSSQADPNYPGLPARQSFEAVDAFDSAVESCDPNLRADAVGTVCARAKEQGLKAYGAYSTITTETAVGNSKGVSAYHSGTRAILHVTVAGDNGSSMSESASWRLADIDAESVGRAAIERALRAQDPKLIEPGKYDVVLGPYAVMDIVNNLNFTGVSAKHVQEGSSWMVGRMGKQVMSPLITIWDDGCDLGGSPLPFDFEGTPRRQVSIVHEGRVIGPVYDRQTALLSGTESTGHAPPPDFFWFIGPIALHLFMAPGSSSLEELIRSTNSGLYINSFHYTRTVHPRDCIITGMTRNGVWKIEDGQLTHPVKDLRFTQSYIEALANVTHVGSEKKLGISETGSSLSVPALKITGFNFTGVTV